jgi:hypothetical protein
LGVSGVEGGDTVTVVVTVTDAGADTVAVTVGVGSVEGGAVDAVALVTAGRIAAGST